MAEGERDRESVVVDGGFSTTSPAERDFSDVVYRGIVAVDTEIFSEVVYRGRGDGVGGGFSATSSMERFAATSSTEEGGTSSAKNSQRHCLRRRTSVTSSAGNSQRLSLWRRTSATTSTEEEETSSTEFRHLLSDWKIVGRRNQDPSVGFVEAPSLAFRHG